MEQSEILQRLLTHSYSGKVLAVRRVTENTGKKTPGVDQVIWKTPEDKIRAVHALKSRGYQSQPLRRVYIPKSDGKTMRPLGIPCMIDRAHQALHLLALDPVLETNADRNSYGFRQKRSCADAIGQCFITLSNAPNTQWILEADIKSCFDQISHDWLLAHVSMDHAILQQWLKSGYMEKHVLHETTDGTPQGGIVSPALANCALDGLQQRGLKLSPTKTVTTHVEKGFDFLGQNVRRYPNGKLLIKPSKKNVKTFLAGIRATIKAGLGMSAADLIDQLNPKIRGWVNYHRHVVAKRTFSYVDHSIFHSLRRWARRRHPKKSSTWLRKKYYERNRRHNRCFFGERYDDEGQPRKVWLYRAKSTPIKRHVKVKGEANPYDPTYETYFEERKGATCWKRFGVLALFAISGMNNVDSARGAIPKSLGSQAGGSITASPV